SVERDANRDAVTSAYEYVCSADAPAATSGAECAGLTQKIAVRDARQRDARDVSAYPTRDFLQILEWQQVRQRIPGGRFDAEVAVHAQPARLEETLGIEL